MTLARQPCQYTWLLQAIYLVSPIGCYTPGDTLRYDGGLRMKAVSRERPVNRFYPVAICKEEESERAQP